MKRVLATVLTASFACCLVGCGGDEKSPKPASGGGGATSPATITPPPKGERPKME